MVGKEYRPNMKPWIRSGEILISREYWNYIRDSVRSVIDRDYLNENLIGKSYCPELYIFNDLTRVRELLGYEQNEITKP